MYLIGTDIGGTFTDCAVLDDTGTVVAFAKAPSTPADPADGVLHALERVAGDLGVAVEALLADTRLFLHGTTIATNALIERKGVPTGLLLTMGHEDTLHIGRVYQKAAGLPEAALIHESRLQKAEPPIVERRDVAGVAERLDWQGLVVLPLNERQAMQAAETLVGRGIQAIAITLLYAYVNNTHERRLADLIRARWPALFVATSHEIAPLQGEYERAATTALTCYLGPKVATYVQSLAERLQAAGFHRQVLLMHAGGGVTSPEDARRRPLQLLDSGPVGGSLGSRFFAGLYDEPNVICTDMGGTSFDVSLVAHGALHTEEQSTIAQYTVLQQKVEITTIGAGGGSIVWLDADGILRVGPESAGAVPGPACYAAGGTRPTVTDANLILGYFNPDYFLGGRIRLDPEAARAAFAPIAERLGMRIEEAALGAARVVNAQMADAIRGATIEKGLDPRQFALFAYGGAASAHAAFFGRALGVKSVYIPRHATVFSALGMAAADVVNTAERALGLRLPVQLEGIARINARFAELDQELRARVAQVGHQAGAVRTERTLYMKYGLQVHQIPVRVPPRALAVADQTELQTAFEREYERLYGQGAGYNKAGIEIVKCRATASVQIATPPRSPTVLVAEPEWAEAVKGTRPAWFPGHDSPLETTIADGDKLQVGNHLRGPVIVERPGDTVVIPPRMVAYVDPYLNIRLALG